MTGNNCICIHGHFYQPPRENPWLEDIELQDSAYPYHDWNQRITAECYAPNASSRILDPEGRIIDIISNYAQISFNFGPTLLSWMEKHDPATYRAILEADRQSRDNFSGHGGAIAQVYNHLIMPLANERDKRTQIIWGLKDFEHRFGRFPEGMWLAETAVDLQTLDLLAEAGIRFTLLAPHQASRTRRIGGRKWRDASGEGIDPKFPYCCRLPSGRSITIFFYDGPISRDIAFSNLLQDGGQLAQRLLGAFTGEGEIPQVVNVATDGETYGHHRRFGDMALAYCLRYIKSNQLARITVYGEYLDRYPPLHEVEIFENSSWSCAHGIERWRSNCGCQTGVRYGWNQEWRAPLREAMDWLRDRLAEVFEREASSLLREPWSARDAYISVILECSDHRVKEFLSQQSSRQLSGREEEKVLKLMEMQRHALLMYTSCGWFFDEISGIETVQIIEYASRAIQLARETSGTDLESGYLKILEKAKSNLPEYKNGSQIYGLVVKPAVIDLLRVGVHYAVSSLFEEYPPTVRIYAYTIRAEEYDLSQGGRQKLAIGRAQVRSDITHEELAFCFAVLHMGDHNLVGAVRPQTDENTWLGLHEEIKGAFLKNDIPEVIRSIDRHFGEHNYSLWHLFHDGRRKVIDSIMAATLKEVENSFRQIYHHHYPLIQILKTGRLPLPRALAALEGFIVDLDFRRALESEAINLDLLRQAVQEMKKSPIEIDKITLNFKVGQKIDELIGQLARNPYDLDLLKKVEGLLLIISELPLEPDLWRAQNSFFTLGKVVVGSQRAQAEAGNEESKKWLALFSGIGEHLKVKLPG